MIAGHACRKYSGRVGRCAAAKDLEESAINLAVVAHVRHDMTDYDEQLARGYERFEALSRVSEKVNMVIENWKVSQ